MHVSYSTTLENKESPCLGKRKRRKSYLKWTRIEKSQRKRRMAYIFENVRAPGSHSDLKSLLLTRCSEAHCPSRVQLAHPRNISRSSPLIWHFASISAHRPSVSSALFKAFVGQTRSLRSDNGRLTTLAPFTASANIRQGRRKKQPSEVSVFILDSLQVKKA